MGEEKSNPSLSWVALSQASFLLTGPTILGVVVDAMADSSPWATVFGVFLGLISCMTWLIRQMNRMKDESTTKSDPNSK